MGNEIQTEEVLGPVDGTTGMMLQSGLKEQHQINLKISTGRGLFGTNSLRGGALDHGSRYMTRKEKDPNAASVNDIGLMSSRHGGHESAAA